MDTATLSTLLDGFAGQRVVVVGDIFIDHHISGVVERLNPEAPVPILHAREESEVTGGAGNVAKNAAALGATVTLLSVVGDDVARQRVEAAAQREGYTATLLSDPTRPTIRKVRYLVGSQQLLRVDYEDTHDISGEVESELIARLQQATTPETSAIIVSDYAKGVITARVAEAILAAAAQHKIMVAADVKPSRAQFFHNVAFISPNLKEGHEYLGLNPLAGEAQEPELLAAQLAEKMNTTVFLTLGAGGMYVHTKDGTALHVPQAHVVEVFDVSGAGDTAIVTLALALRAGATAEQAAIIANAAGAVVVGKVGSAAVSVAEIKDMVTHQHS